jgi:agmatinase
MSYGTFLNAPHCRPEDAPAGAVALVGVPHDSTHTTRLGTRYGPRAIRAASTAIAEAFARAPGHALAEDPRATLVLPSTPRVVDVGDAPVVPNDLEQTTEAVRVTMRTLARRGTFPILLGGDHYISFPSFWGFSEGVPRTVNRVGTSTSTATSTSTMTTRCGDGSTTAECHRVSSSTLSIRATWSGSGSTASWARAVVHTQTEPVDGLHPRRVQQLGPAGGAPRAGIAGERTDCVYVSFDIDVIDTAFAPGTGGVVIGGMSPGQMRAVLEVLREANVGALDLMEVSPVLDPSGRTARYAAELLTHFLAPRLFDLVPGSLAGAEGRS